jgi:hypothetical protein
MSLLRESRWSPAASGFADRSPLPVILDLLLILDPLHRGGELRSGQHVAVGHLEPVPLPAGRPDGEHSPSAAAFDDLGADALHLGPPAADQAPERGPRPQSRRGLGKRMTETLPPSRARGPRPPVPDNSKNPVSDKDSGTFSTP